MSHFQQFTISETGYNDYFRITKEEFLLFPENVEVLKRLANGHGDFRERLLCSSYMIHTDHKSCWFEVWEDNSNFYVKNWISVYKQRSTQSKRKEVTTKKRYTYKDFERKKTCPGSCVSVGMFGEEIYAMSYNMRFTVSEIGITEYFRITEEEFMLFPENCTELEHLINRNDKERWLCSDYNLDPNHKGSGFEV